jgi:hypothetical protein
MNPMIVACLIVAVVVAGGLTMVVRNRRARDSRHQQ